MNKQSRKGMFAVTAIAVCLGLVTACDQGSVSAPAPTDRANADFPEEGTNSEIVSDIEDKTSAIVGAVKAEFTTTTQGFIDAISLYTMYERVAVEIALERSHEPAVLDFADALDEGGGQMQEALEEAVLASSIPVQEIEELDARYKVMLDNLRGASEEDFETRFLEQQVNANDEALRLASNYAKDGGSPQVRAFAADMAPTLEQWLARAKALSERIAEQGEG